MGRGHQDKIAVITGGASGIGQASAQRLAEDGAAIVLVDRQPAEETLRLVRAAGRDGIAVRCDIAQQREVEALAAQVAARFGRCDILVNCAAIAPPRFFAEMSFEDWRQVMAVNLDGMFLVTKAFASGMRERRWGRIVNFASNTVGMVLTGMSHYIASKGGVIGLTRALASEFGPDGVTVNAIAPGLTRTPLGMTAQTRHPDPEDGFAIVASRQAIKRTELPADLVGTVSFLTSDDAAFITGQTIYVDGGLVRV